MILFISSFGIISAVIPDPKIFFWIAASVSDTAAVNASGIKTLLTNVLSTFFIKGKKTVFSSGPKSLPRNSPDCSVLCNGFFDNFILADEFFEKALLNHKFNLLSCEFYV